MIAGLLANVKQILSKTLGLPENVCLPVVGILIAVIVGFVVYKFFGEKIKSANELTNEIIETILDDIKPNQDDEILLHVNGFGGTPLMELYLLFECGQKLLAKQNVRVARSIVGNYTTSLEMAGASFTITKLDDNIIKHWDSPVHTSSLRWKI